LRGRGGRSFSFDEEREGLGWLGQMIEKIEKKIYNEKNYIRIDGKN
jgi:hypothetical protein